VENKELLQKTELVCRESEKAFERLEDMMNNNLCMVSHFTGVMLI
jgi:hypothetical protein